MGNFSLFYPTGTTNKIPNPSFEDNSNGMVGITATIARTATKQSRGTYALAVTLTGTATNIGMVFTGTSLTAGTVHNFSTDIYAPASTILKVAFLSTSNVVLASTIFTGTGDWQRVNVSWTETGTALRRVGVLTNQNLNGQTFYVDGLQLENGPQTSYCDGDVDDCFWNGGRHNSTSTRPNTSTIGGIEKDLEDVFGLKIISANGIGMPEVENLSTALAIQPGAFFQGYSVSERVLNLIAVFQGTSARDLHSKRQAFINSFKPGNEYILKYKLPNKPVLLKVVYDSGLGFGNTFGTNERIALRLIAYEPYWYEEYQQGSTLTPQQSISSANRLMQRDSDGDWHSLSTGVKNIVYALVRGDDNTLYIGGAFPNPSGYGVGDGFAYYRDNNLYGIVTGTNQEVIKSIVQVFVKMPDGKIFCGGNFGALGTNVGAAFYNPNTNTFTNLATGSASSASKIFAACLDRDGNLIVGGDFTTINGIATNETAKRDAVTGVWSSIGDPGGTVHSLKLGPDGNIYIGVDGVGLKVYDGTSITTLGAMQAGEIVYDLEFNPGGLLHLGGLFSGTATLGQFFSTYNGYTFTEVGNPGVNGTVYSLKYNKVRNTFILAGNITTANNLSITGRAVEYNGTSFVPIDIHLPGDNTIYAVDIANDGTLTFGFDTTGTAITSAVTELANRSTAPTFPVFEFSVSGTATATQLYQIRNEDTNQTIYFNLTIQPGETIVIDLRKKTITSSYRGNVISKILKGSNFASFALTTSNPRISLFADKASLVAKVYWEVTHFSADGSS
jgi:hypothetical protein